MNRLVGRSWCQCCGDLVWESRQLGEFRVLKVMITAVSYVLYFSLSSSCREDRCDLVLISLVLISYLTW